MSCLWIQKLPSIWTAVFISRWAHAQAQRDWVRTMFASICFVLIAMKQAHRHDLHNCKYIPSEAHLFWRIPRSWDPDDGKFGSRIFLVSRSERAVCIVLAVHAFYFLQTCRESYKICMFVEDGVDFSRVVCAAGSSVHLPHPALPHLHHQCWYAPVLHALQSVAWWWTVYRNPPSRHSQ